jgi:hypothetical protein
MTKVHTLIASLGVVTLTAACGFEHSTNVIAPTAPTTNTSTTPSAPSMMGVWTSNALPAGVPDPGSCGNFQFQVSDQNATSISGSFTAECGGGVTISGAGQGQLNGAAVTLTVRGNASGSLFPGGCAFDLTANGNVEDNGYALPLSYQGTTCLGPVHGNTTLRRPQPQAPAPTPPPPAPEPEPMPEPTPAPPSAPDGFNLNDVRIVGGSPDVRGWAITSDITSIGFGGGSFHIDHTRRCGWPGVDIGGALQESTIWVFERINGQWYGTGGERLRPCQTDKGLGSPGDIANGWFYNAFWAPFNGHQPAPGEMVGFMITAGSTRADNNAPVHERTRIVMIPWPGANGGGSWNQGSFAWIE